jgi:hypothetical protein
VVVILDKDDDKVDIDKDPGQHDKEGIDADLVED